MQLALQFEEEISKIPRTENREIILYERHYALLRKWNDQAQLVSEKTLSLAFAPHYVDSLYISDFAYCHGKGTSLLDVGSGGGFPGIVFAIRYPDQRIVLLEKQKMKNAFLQVVKTELNLQNISIERQIPETLDGLVVSRAVFPIQELFAVMSKHLGKEAKFIVSLGSAVQSRPPAHFKLIDEQKYHLPCSAGARINQCFTWNKV